MISDSVYRLCEDLKNNSNSWENDGYNLTKNGVSLWYRNTFLDMEIPCNIIEKWVIRKAQSRCLANMAIGEKKMTDKEIWRNRDGVLE